MFYKTSFTFTFNFILMLSMSTSVYASPNPSENEDKAPDVKALARSIGAQIPTVSPKASPGTPLSPRTKTPSTEKESTEPKKGFSLSGLLKRSTSISSDNKIPSPRSGSPDKSNDAPPLSPSVTPSRVRGFSYTQLPGSSGAVASSSTPQNTFRDSLTESSGSSGSLSPEKKESDSPKRSRSKSLISKKDKEIVLGKPVTTIPFITIKDPEAEAQELLKIAVDICSNTLAPLVEIETSSNERIELVVKPMLSDLKNSIKEMTQRIEETALADKPTKDARLGDPVSFFRMTVKRAETDIPAAVNWAMEKLSENSDLERYFETMLVDARKDKAVISSEHTKTQSTLMNLAQGLYFPLVTKHAEQTRTQLEGRDLVINFYLSEYTTYMNGMNDRLKKAIGNSISFNALNREFNPTIMLMHANLLKALSWAIGKEESFDPELKQKFDDKLAEFKKPNSSNQ